MNEMHDGLRATSVPGATDAQGEAGDTRLALLAAGRSLFAARGYDGASVRALTEAAGANLGAITYHFGSKRAFYEEVLREAVLPLARRVEAVTRAEGSPLDRCAEVVRAYADHLADTPDLPHLLLQEIAAGKPPPEPVASVFRRVAGAVAGVIHEGQHAGVVREGDPLLLTLSLVSQPIYLTLVRRAVAHVMGVDPLGPDTRGDTAAHMATFARAALAAPEAP